MLVLLQLVGVADTPLNVTELVPCAAPSVVPVTVTDAPTGAVGGERLVIAGATVNADPPLARFPTVTTALPVVAALGTGAVIVVLLQVDGAVATPLNATLLPFCVGPKFDPVIVTDAPVALNMGDKLAITGAATV
jgi:hypothetical protein